jgi:hypothetical protein
MARLAATGPIAMLYYAISERKGNAPENVPASPVYAHIVDGCSSVSDEDFVDPSHNGSDIPAPIQHFARVAE